MTYQFTQIPIFLGDTFGSTLSVMLFPDSLAKARSWHARYLSKGALQKYLEAGHSFDDRFPAFATAVGEDGVDTQQVMARLAGAGLAADVFKVLWALICDGDEKASWSRAIEQVCDSTSVNEAGSASHIRKQLRLFAPVLHLWLGWRLSNEGCPRETELFHIGYPILFEARAWAQSRPEAFRPADSYLSVREFGPWPELARQMEREGGCARRLSLCQDVQRKL